MKALYLLLPPHAMGDAYAAHPDLFAQFCKGETGAREVLLDVLLEYIPEKVLGSTDKWTAALIIQKKWPAHNLFWIG